MSPRPRRSLPSVLDELSEPRSAPGRVLVVGSDPGLPPRLGSELAAHLGACLAPQGELVAFLDLAPHPSLLRRGSAPSRLSGNAALLASAQLSLASNVLSVRAPRSAVTHPLRELTERVGWTVVALSWLDPLRPVVLSYADVLVWRLCGAPGDGGLPHLDAALSAWGRSLDPVLVSADGAGAANATAAGWDVLAVEPPERSWHLGSDDRLLALSGLPHVSAFLGSVLCAALGDPSLAALPRPPRRRWRPEARPPRPFLAAAESLRPRLGLDWDVRSTRSFASWLAVRTDGSVPALEVLDALVDDIGRVGVLDLPALVDAAAALGR